jgi:serine/threonine-protein kinase
VDRIGHYKIVSELGRGGMGVVLKAHEESLNRFVAIKVLGEHLEQDDEYVQRFVREAQSAAALSHPNIVQIYAISEDQGHHYFVMEYVQGTSVQRMIQTKGKIHPPEAARLILQAAAGLQDAHAQDVIHRDIKPANLMVTNRGLVKIADFGLALMGGGTSRLTATGMLMGTPGYLSPEQCLDQSPDQRTDIYSLGVTFFEMVTGTMPFRADSPLALLRLIIEVEPPDIREINPEVDDELRGIIARMLAKNREDRYPSCTEVIADLQDWLEARGESMHRVAGAAATGTAAGVMSPPPPPVTQEQINSEPTVVVESGSTKPAPPAAPPPTPPAPVPDPVVAAPEPRATVPATQPQPEPTRSRTGLLVAVIAIVVLGAGAAAAFLAVKTGVLDRIIGRNDLNQIAELSEPHETSAGEPDDAAVLKDMDSQGEETPSHPPGGGVESETTDPPVVRGHAPPTVTGSETGATTPKARDSSKTSNLNRELDTTVKDTASTSPPPQIVAPPPTATVVFAVGEPLLAVEAEEYVKGRLRHAGVEILEITAIPGLEGFVNTESRPSPEQVREALRPYARFLVPLRVEYLGDRAISYMGQRDTVYQARVNMGLVDLQSGRSMGKPEVIKIEYTQLNADEVVARDLRKATTGIVQKHPR